MTECMLNDLCLAKKGDKAASERLVEDNSGLIWSVARRFFGRGVEPDDLYQLGCLGFLKAVAGFDPGFGTQFSTYAVPKIAGEIRRFLRDDGTVKVSRGIKERALHIKNARCACGRNRADTRGHRFCRNGGKSGRKPAARDGRRRLHA